MRKHKFETAATIHGLNSLDGSDLDGFDGLDQIIDLSWTTWTALTDSLDRLLGQTAWAVSLTGLSTIYSSFIGKSAAARARSAA